jgi:hypothetical protein
MSLTLTGVQSIRSDLIPKIDFFDTSLSGYNKATIGNLTMPGVDNGRYESKHPIHDKSGLTYGHMVGGVMRIGYTYAGVYSDSANAFFLAHLPFTSVPSYPAIGFISQISPSGSFLFGNKGVKFKQTFVKQLPGEWITDIKAYKLFENGKRLLILTDKGFTVYNTHNQVYEFDPIIIHSYACIKDFSISPDYKYITIAVSRYMESDEIDGTQTYSNYIEIYELKDGLKVGGLKLPHTTETNWNIRFALDDRTISLTAGSQCYEVDYISNY